MNDGVLQAPPAAPPPPAPDLATPTAPGASPRTVEDGQRGSPCDEQHDTVAPPPVVRFALRTFFMLAAKAPWILDALRPFMTYVATRCCADVRSATDANARRIFGRELSRAEQQRFERQVVGSFYDFVLDVGRHRDATAEQLRARIEEVEGLDAYFACRKRRCGAILVTAHMGSFEVGLASLMSAEPKVHVVYKRDAFGTFDAMRARLRERLGVSSIAIDDGWPSLMAMKDALARDEVVVLQADRAMPGQRAQSVPLLHGHLSLPLGPVTLARLFGSPIVPVFTTRTTRQRFRLDLLPPIEMDDAAVQADADGAIDPTLRRIADAIESFIARYPDQWLVLHRAFIEDQPKHHGRF